MSEAAEKLENEEIDYDSMSDEEFNLLNSPDDKAVVDVEEKEAKADEIEEELIQEEKIDEVSEEEEKEETIPEETKEVEKTVTENKVESTGITSIEELLKTKLKLGQSEIAINSVEELVTLAQRGLGANKRIQELAPKLKLISTLESNNLLDKEKLNFLIALDKKDPEAIKKLVASSGVDVFDADLDEANKSYVPKDYSVSDKQYAIQQAFEQISTSESYESTIKTISSFDEDSKAEIRNAPNLIIQLNTHHENGVYKQIEDIVLKERAVGNLVGLSDFAAYKHVWNTVQEHLASTGGIQEAGHKNLTNDSVGGENLARTEGIRETGHNAKQNMQGNAQNAARKAAESTNRNRGSVKAATINLDELSDEQIKSLDGDAIFS